ncbi:isoprenoid synthase domain-containing protein [Polychytrium aggregatum]|uniref:isoprenoid synthase domain-containing protein n=1 Tax=Polychytrium aggregatum TaxID=110093 RepID=UPI0022FE19E2|nr:isoprenoid synthase domain-containing protein [Polychytrium aggregatum]KAI9207028.1 isoprenoid synthase domain-containing protein [Polychytrium aggregatum]
MSMSGSLNRLASLQRSIHHSRRAFRSIRWQSTSASTAAFTAPSGSDVSPKPSPLSFASVSSFFSTKKPSDPLNWNQAVAAAESLVHAKGGSVINPKELLGQDLALITENIRKLLGSGHPVLNTISNYYFNKQGKHVRPILVLLIAQATSLAPKLPNWNAYDELTLNSPISETPRSCEVQFIGGSMIAPQPNDLKSSVEITPSNPSPDLPSILPSQRRLAEITEMIHTASLLHDDVIDDAMTRRSQPSANAQHGNKMAILAGDFLLARASVALARLRNVQVVELLATVISNLVEGEFMQLRNTKLQSVDGADRLLSTFEYYMEKTYMKTASLIAKSCQGSAVLGGCTVETSEIAYLYGKNIGLAFQVVDDILDFVVSADELGKPAGADLSLGLATAPVLYAAEQYPELWPLIERKFEKPGDVQKAHELVLKSNGIQRARTLAAEYCDSAIREISKLPSSPAREALIQITQSVLTRKK